MEGRPGKRGRNWGRRGEAEFAVARRLKTLVAKMQQLEISLLDKSLDLAIIRTLSMA